MLFDMHVHTSESSCCGRLSGAEAAKLYKKAGYDGIVITDHFMSYWFNYYNMSWKNYCKFHAQGYKSAKQMGDKIGLKVLYGCELRIDCTSPNDYLVYGISNKFMVEHPEILKFSVEQLVEFADKNGLLVYQAHPLRHGSVVVDYSKLFGVEVFNGKGYSGSGNDRQMNDITNLIAERYSLHKISGSDFHDVNDLASGGLKFNCKIKDNNSLVEALKNDRYMLLANAGHCRPDVEQRNC